MAVKTRTRSTHPPTRSPRGEAVPAVRTPARSPAKKKANDTAAPSPAAGAGSGAGGWTPQAGEVGIRVRMYRVGFGDFFLVSILDAAGDPVHVIVDCGVFKGTSGTGDIGSIKSAVAHMVQETRGRVALILMTHRHADHIAGFARCADTFRTLTVDAVWMPIWEKEYEPTALKFQAELTRTALGLQSHFRALGANASEAERTARSFMENALGEAAVFGAAAAGGGSNAKALDLLKHGFKGVEPEYYQRSDAARLPQALVDAGLSAKILGPPPVSDVDLMKLMDLQKNVGQYLAGEGGESGETFAPFGSEWETNPKRQPPKDEREYYTSISFREWVEKPRKATGSVTDEESARARDRAEAVVRGSQPIAALTAATQLNAFLNNQSLAVLFTFKGKKLLFVGDAQAGNWEHWLFDTDKPDKKASGTMDAVARQVLTSLDFYKVGHHGSSNSTPRTAAETMGAPGHKFVCMCSTEKDVYGTERPDDPSKGTEVPRGPLLDKLASDGALVRSDQIEIVGDDGEKIPPLVTTPLPAPIPGSRIEPGPLWVDCYL